MGGVVGVDCRAPKEEALFRAHERRHPQSRAMGTARPSQSVTAFSFQLVSN
jgi:hypothetical protein